MSNEFEYLQEISYIIANCQNVSTEQAHAQMALARALTNREALMRLRTFMLMRQSRTQSPR